MSTSTTEWKRQGRGQYLTTDGRLYISRTRDGWEYGTVEDGIRYRLDESTRPLQRVKVLAERGEVVPAPTTYYVELHVNGAWMIVHEGTNGKTALSVFTELGAEGRRVRLESVPPEEEATSTPEEDERSKARKTRRLPIIGAALLALVMAAPAVAATPRERALTKQVRQLKAANAKLTRERSSARASLASCQGGVPSAIATMTPEQLSRDVLPVAKARFDAYPGSIALGWSAYTLDSHTVSTGSYESWTWTFDFTRWLS
jgi:hypothetical protein